MFGPGPGGKTLFFLLGFGPVRGFCRKTLFSAEPEDEAVDLSENLYRPNNISLFCSACDIAAEDDAGRGGGVEARELASIY